MRIECLLPIVFLMSYLVKGQGVDPEIAHDPLLNKLNGEVAIIKQDNSVTHYDKNNSVSKRIYYDANGNKNEEIYFYDATGKFLEKIITVDSKGRETGKIYFKYNGSGQLISRKVESEYSSGDYESTTEYQDNRVTKQLLVYSVSKDSIITVYKYDKKGNRIEEVQKTPKLSGKGGYERKNFEYNNQNLLVKVLVYDYEFSHSRTFTYDDKNNLIEIATTHKESSPYDNVKKYKYEHGNLVEFITDYVDDELDEHLTYQYEFDSAHNLIHKSIYKEGTLIFELKREIKYQ